jgi:peptide/nickel transport system permease protein
LLRAALRRLLSLAGIVLAMVALVFALGRALPGSAVEMMLGNHPTAAQIEQARKELGLDRPLLWQFGRFLGHAAQGDWGSSLRTGRPVREEVSARLAASAELVSCALVLAVGLGVPLGVWAAARRAEWPDRAARLGSAALVAAPVFFLAILLQMLFSGRLGWLPLQGRIDADLMLNAPLASGSGWLLIDSLLQGRFDALGSAQRHLALPVLTLAAASLATIVRVTRNLMIEVLQADHVRTLRAYGLGSREILFRFALRATLVPLLTVVGLTYGFLLGGSVIVEVVFDWPGIGAYIVDSVVNNDTPAVIGITLVLSTLYLLINLGVDLLQMVLDPRSAR